VASEEHRGLPDLSLREWAILAPMMAAIVFLGVFPKPLLNKIEPSVDQTVHCEWVALGRHEPGQPVTGGAVPVPCATAGLQTASAGGP
jgi:NADH-quinone oxidoreductase subunit M